MASGNTDYENVTGELATGSHVDTSGHQVVCYPFGKYEIIVKVGEGNKFLGILEVRINKDFLAHRRKTAPPDYHDVDEFYRE